MNKELILIRYGELNTKGKNRKYFINRLTSNLKKQLNKFDDIHIKAYRDRMFVELNSKNLEEVLQILPKVFGIYSFSLAKRMPLDIAVFKKVIMETIDFDQYQTFKVITNRGNKTFPLSSDEVNREIGSIILQQTDLTAQMKDYDLAINIDIRHDSAYLFLEKRAGAKGYPVGVSGKGLLMLSGGIDSPVAGYLMMKRGVHVDVIHFASPPYTSPKALHKVITLTSKLLEYTDAITFYNVPFTEMQLAINKAVKPSYSMVVMRRMMYRICEIICEQDNYDIIINGDSIAQVASQTLPSMKVINEVVKTPIIRPLAGFDKEEIIKLAQKIGTYETSILPYEDCCTIFLPTNPIIDPQLSIAKYQEQNFDFLHQIDIILEGTKIMKINPKTIDALLMDQEVEEEEFF
jgi:tRNA uracil 4-sulfurtransferase